ncbi:ribose 5-phosphate isomerase B [Liquorilactobacillus mali]|uniref:Ribose-5-phosphate isomerase B n=1 Tax=Liquorilactobacillus mali TaxID=1618 RepID=A0A0R2FNC1_9LACO|nr:ribose 5-phosphate isomerase B [Liquorilactobacillus mali]KRN30083.1 ribose-5-phosphate isomerase B [Liquorilactobacillus mali]
MKKIVFGSDHAGFSLKEELIPYVKSLEYQVIDLGTFSKESTDYPIYGKKVGEIVANAEADLGIVICGTGIGISIAANKIPGVRAACVTNLYGAEYSKKHNNANVLALGARMLNITQAKEIVNKWLQTDFESGRHQRRIDEISALDERDVEKFERISGNR